MTRDVTSLPPVPADERVRYGSDPSQFFDLFAAAGKPRGFAVMIHGGFWRARYDLAHASHLCAALARGGIATANLEYRRVGNGGGWPATFDDVRDGVRKIAQTFGKPPVVLGHSAGGELALCLAAESSEIAAVVALAPVADLRLAYQLNLSNGAVREFLGGTPEEVPHAYAAACPARHAASLPRLLVHGTADDVVPIALSRSFIKARAADPGQPRLIEIPGADHFELIDPESQVWPTVHLGVLTIME